MSTSTPRPHENPHAGLRRDTPEHPENDLHGAADYYNKVRPEPRDFDELADQPDPVEVNERNRASTRQAIVFAVATVLGTLLFGGALALVARLAGGPLCDAGEATWLCSSGWRTAWAILSSIPPVVALLACAVITVPIVHSG